MRLLFVFRKLGGGGVTTGAINRLNYLIQHTDFEIHVLSELENEQAIQNQFSSKIHFHVLPISHLIKKKRFPIVGYFQLLKEVKTVYQQFVDQLNPDIITGFNFGYNKEILPFISTNAIKIVELRGSYASSGLLKKKKDLIDYFKTDYRKLQNMYNLAILISKEDVLDRNYLTIAKKHIYNDVFIPQEDELIPFNKRQKVILAVGTLTHNKNFKDLIHAARLIKKTLQDWEIHIYGSGQEKDFLNNLIYKHNLQEIVKLKGFNYQMNCVYNDSRMLISSSLSEGFGRTIAEALASKTPVIAYNCKCGPKEIITDGKNGFLINFNPKVLAEKMKFLIDNPNLLEEFSHRAHDGIHKFEHKHIMNEWLQFYKSIYNSKNYLD